MLSFPHYPYFRAFQVFKNNYLLSIATTIMFKLRITSGSRFAFYFLPLPLFWAHISPSQVYLTRKGAVSAKSGEFGIIPGSMGAKTYIVRGKGNPESFHRFYFVCLKT